MRFISGPSRPRRSWRSGSSPVLPRSGSKCRAGQAFQRHLDHLAVALSRRRVSDQAVIAVHVHGHHRGTGVAQRPHGRGAQPLAARHDRHTPASGPPGPGHRKAPHDAGTDQPLLHRHRDHCRPPPHTRSATRRALFTVFAVPPAAASLPVKEPFQAPTWTGFRRQPAHSQAIVEVGRVASDTHRATPSEAREVTRAKGSPVRTRRHRSGARSSAAPRHPTTARQRPPPGWKPGRRAPPAQEQASGTFDVAVLSACWADPRRLPAWGHGGTRAMVQRWWP